jgi:hypothetical protein
VLGDEHAVLDRLTQRLAHIVLRQARHHPQQRVAHLASGGRSQPQQALCRPVERGHPLEQKLA